MLSFAQIYGIIYSIKELTEMKEDKLSDLSMQVTLDVLQN